MSIYRNTWTFYGVHRSWEPECDKCGVNNILLFACGGRCHDQCGTHSGLPQFYTKQQINTPKHMWSNLRKLTLWPHGVVLSYEPKHAINQLTINSEITTLQETTILCLPSAVLSLQIKDSVSPREAFTFSHSLRHWLSETKQHSHDANVTMATEVAPSVS